MSYQVRDATPADLLWLANNMREVDRQEILASNGAMPAQAMMYGGYLKAACLDNVPALVFGVVPSPDPRIGIVWMLATDLLSHPKARRYLARHSREWVEEMNSRFPLLTNMADARNEVHLKWLKFCGFKFIRKFNHGPCNVPFIEFARIR